MNKLLVSFIVAFVLLIFSAQNLHPIWVRLVVGPAVQLPVILVIAVSFIAGYMAATFSHILNGAKAKKKDIDFEDE